MRLTVVTIVGLIGTIATGFLGMNLIDATAESLSVKVIYFIAVMIPSIALTFLTVTTSGRLAKFIDVMANEQLSVREKLRSFVRRSQLPKGLRR